MSNPFNMQAAADAANTIKKAVEQLAGMRDGLLVKRGGHEARLRLLWAMPLQAEELKALVLQQIDDVGAQYPHLAGWSEILNSYAHPGGLRPAIQLPLSFPGSALTRHAGPINLADAEYVRTSVGGALAKLDLVANGASASLISGGDTEGPLEKKEVMETARFYFFLGDIVKQRVGEYFDRHFQPGALRYPHDATERDKTLTTAQRAQEIECLERTIAQIDEELREVDLQLVALPGQYPAKAEAGLRLNLTMGSY